MTESSDEEIHKPSSAILTYLSWEPQARGHTTHCRGHQMIQVPVCRIAQLKGSEAYVIQSLVVDAVSFVSVFNELMH